MLKLSAILSDGKTETHICSGTSCVLNSGCMRVRNPSVASLAFEAAMRRYAFSYIAPIRTDS